MRFDAPNLPAPLCKAAGVLLLGGLAASLAGCSGCSEQNQQARAGSDTADATAAAEAPPLEMDQVRVTQAPDAQSSQEPRRYLIDLSKGDRFRMRYDVTRLASVVGGTGKQGISSEEQYIFQFEVLEERRGSELRMAMAFGPVQFRQGQTGLPADSVLHFNSKDPAPAPKRPELIPFRRLAGQEIQFTLSPVGEISDIAGAKALRQHLMKTSQFPAPMQQRIRRNLQARYSANALKRKLQVLFPRVPRRKIGPAMRWERKHFLPGNFRFDCTTSYFVRKKAGDHLKLTLEGHARSDTTQDINYGQKRATPDLRGSYQGGAELVAQTGLYRRLRYTLEAKGKLHTAGGTAQPLSIRKTVRLERLADEAPAQPGKPTS
jgi:hypothetical protein